MTNVKLIIGLVLGLLIGIVTGIFVGMNCGVHIRTEVDKAASQLGSEEPKCIVFVQPAQPGSTVAPEMLTAMTLSDLRKGMVDWDSRNMAIGATLNIAVPKGAPVLWQYLNPKNRN